MAYDLSPSKETYRSLRSDVNPISSVKELVDNILDNWRRLDDIDDPDLTIDIDFDFENRVFRIEDNSGGISDGEIHKIFALGESSKSKIPFSIGSYGMGAKKAIIRLGNKAEIKSRTPDSDTGYGFIIDQEWLSSKDWEVDRLEFDTLQKGSTIIRIEDLQIETKEESDDGDSEDENEPEFESSSDFLTSLRDDLSETYVEFLVGRAGPESGSLEIKVNGEPVTAPPKPEWSLTPFDGFHPRHFKLYKINPDRLRNRDSPVWVNLKVGLLRKGESAEAGTDIIIQSRKIKSAVQDETGGWGNFLSEFGPQKRRTKVILELSAKDNPEDLPWDTQKSHIDKRNEIIHEAFNFLKRASKEYANARYEPFPISLTAPYSETLDTLNRKSREFLDYSSKYRVTDRPDSNYIQSSEVLDLVNYHKKEGYFIPWLVKQEYRQGYRAEYDPNARNPSGDYIPDGPKAIPEIEGDYSESEIHGWLSEVQKRAKEHAANSIRIDFSGEDHWWQPFYEYHLTEAGEDPVGEYACTESVPEVDEIIEGMETRNELPNPILKETAAGDSSGDDYEGEDDGKAGQGQVKSDQKENEDEIGSDSGEKKQNNVTQNGEGDAGHEEDKAENGEHDVEEGDGSELNWGGTEEKGQIGKGDGSKPIIITLSEEEYNAICEEIEIDPEKASPQFVGSQILKQRINITGFLDQFR